MTDNEQRFKNMILYKMYMTDREMDEITPTLGVMVAIILVGLGIAYYFLG